MSSLFREAETDSPSASSHWIYSTPSRGKSQFLWNIGTSSGHVTMEGLTIWKTFRGSEELPPFWLVGPSMCKVVPLVGAFSMAPITCSFISVSGDRRATDAVSTNSPDWSASSIGICPTILFNMPLLFNEFGRWLCSREIMELVVDHPEVSSSPLRRLTTPRSSRAFFLKELSNDSIDLFRFFPFRKWSGANSRSTMIRETKSTGIQSMVSLDPRETGNFPRCTELAIRLGIHSCLLHIPSLIVGPAIWPTRQIVARREDL